MAAAKTLPMIANPAVEPIARCELRMPEAIPDRSGGMEPIATLVAAATDEPAGRADERQRRRVPPTTLGVAHGEDARADCDGSRVRSASGVRAPRAATMRPVSGDRMIVGIVIASSKRPGLLRAVATHVLEVLRDDEQRAVYTEQRREHRIDSGVVRPDSRKRECPSSDRSRAARSARTPRVPAAAAAKPPRMTADHQPSWPPWINAYVSSADAADEQ